MTQLASYGLQAADLQARSKDQQQHDSLSQAPPGSHQFCSWEPVQGLEIRDQLKFPRAIALEGSQVRLRILLEPQLNLSLVLLVHLSLGLGLEELPLIHLLQLSL
jgi:hypothetical protein